MDLKKVPFLHYKHAIFWLFNKEQINHMVELQDYNTITQKKLHNVQEIKKLIKIFI
jgi:hypothetical protein